MNPLYFAISAGVLNALSAQILKSQPQNNEEQSGFQIVMATFAVALSSLIVVFMMLTTFNSYYLIFVPCGLAMGLFGFINFVTICVALRRGPMSIVWPTAWLAAPLSGTIWFIITWFTDFTYWHALGISLFVLCLYFMSKSKQASTAEAGTNETKAPSPNDIKPYFFLHVALGMLSGVFGNFVTKFVTQIPHAQEVIPQLTMIASANLLSSISLYFMWKYFFKTRITLPKPAQIGRSVLNASLGICMFFLTIYGLKDADIATFMCSYAGVAISGAVVMAYFFQKEKISKPVLVGIVCALFAIGSFAIGDKIVKELADAKKAEAAKKAVAAPVNPGK